MAYKKEINCEMCGEKTIARTSQKRFCGDCKMKNRRSWRKEWLKISENLEKHKIGLQIARKKYPETKRENQKRYNKKHPERNKIYNMAKKIPLEKECGICKSSERLERHHWNYNKPLLVSTLCKSCHTIQHIKHFKGVI